MKQKPRSLSAFQLLNYCPSNILKIWSLSSSNTLVHRRLCNLYLVTPSCRVKGCDKYKVPLRRRAWPPRWLGARPELRRCLHSGGETAVCGAREGREELDAIESRFMGGTQRPALAQDISQLPNRCFLKVLACATRFQKFDRVHEKMSKYAFSSTRKITLYIQIYVYLSYTKNSHYILLHINICCLKY